MNFAQLLLGASALVFVASVAGCASESEGPATLECVDTCSTSLPKRGDSSTPDPALTPTTPNGNGNVARPVTPATPPSVVPSAAATTTSAPPPPEFTTKPITRKYLDGDHLFTRDALEAPSWIMEGQPFLVFDAVHPDTQPIYRCRAGTQHFVTNDAGCEGQSQDGGELGWLSTTPGTDRFELVRCRNATGSDHLASTREECAGAGYVVEGTLGYAKKP